ECASGRREMPSITIRINPAAGNGTLRRQRRGRVARYRAHSVHCLRVAARTREGALMRTFKSLSEREILALAISLEEEEARIYADFAEGLRADFPAVAQQFAEMRVEEDGHRHRLLTLYRQKFGEHIPLIRRQDVQGFVSRRPVWLIRPLGLAVVRKQAETMELETRRFYEKAARQATDAGVRQLLGDLAEEERKHSHLVEE